jgi:hypothetical protein
MTSGSTRVPSCVWRISDAVVVALDERLGQPVDSYVNGAQTWLREDGPAGEMLEWRLHPVAGFARPAGTGTHELFEVVALALGTGAPAPAEPSALWGGLEAFVAYTDEATEIEPMRLAEICTAVLGIAPDASGMVDHEPIGVAWEQAEGRHSVIDALFEQLGG